jgi:glycosyltransferase involved in cell wall biosynthesis
MIVRNEAHVLERCLEAVRPLIDAASICDTGSEDGTAELAESWLARHGVPGRVHRHAFQDFGQNRTLSIRAAQETLRELGCDLDRGYLLFLDADMVLQVAAEFTRPELCADVYSVAQRNAGLVYWNVRLARASLPAVFVGATHEYFCAPAGARQESLATLSIDDHNDGGSRGDKYERDRRLLEEQLRRDPRDGRSMFYLAQTFRGLGDLPKALFWYRRRIQTGGWAEEVWYSHYAIGLLYLEAGETRPALRAFHTAIRLNPRRAEPYFHVARHLRSRGRNLLAFLYARAGLARESPAEGSLFVEQDVYDWGLLRELSIAGYYTRFREEGFEANERLAVGRGAPAHLSALAASNGAFYARALPDVSYASITPALPPGFVPCNPSILRTERGYLVNCRAVGYRIDGHQRYVPAEADGVLRTRNFLMRLGLDLAFLDQVEIQGDVEPLRESRVRGLEDCRLVERGGKVAFTCSTADCHPSGLIQESLVTLDERLRVERHLPLWGHEDDRHQKNWLPFVDPLTGSLRAIYGYEPLVILEIDPVTGRCEPILREPSGRNVGHFRGSAGPIDLPEEAGGGRLFLIHEVVLHGLRYYLHRFVSVDSRWRIERISRPFFFRQLGIEFVCGACLAHGDRELLITLGVEDREAWLCRISLDTLARLLRPLPDAPGNRGV